MKEWAEFFTLTGGAAATLTGLIFIGISINLDKILSISQLPDRAAQALILLVTVMIVSILSLVPGQGMEWFGAEILSISILVWIINTRLDMHIFRKTAPEYKNRHLRINVLLTQFSLVPYVISAVVLIGGSNAGLYVLIPGFVFSFIKATLDAWVLLVEIKR